MKQKHFRNDDGDVKQIMQEIEGIEFRKDPLDLFIMLARYKFASRFLKKDHHNVLDVGCGVGLGSIFLSKFAKSVTGVDIDPDLISSNKNSFDDIKNLDFDVLNLLDPDARYLSSADVVVSMDVIEHFQREDINNVVQNYCSLLRPNGFAVIGTPNIESQRFASQRRLEIHPFEFSAAEFREALEKSFSNVFLFSMNDEIVSTQYDKMAWYLMALCVK